LGVRDPLDPLRIEPQTLEAVVLPLLLAEDVHDHVDVVEQHPARLVLALAPDRTDADGAESFLDLLDDRLHLAIARAGADHEEVDDREDRADLEHENFLRLLCGGRPSRGDRELAALPLGARGRPHLHPLIRSRGPPRS